MARTPVVVLFVANILSRLTFAWEAAEGIGWQRMTDEAPWEAHTGSIAMPLTDGSTVLIAGQAGRHGGANFDCFNCTKDVWKFDESTAAWTNLSKDVPWDPRWGHSAVVLPDDTIWMMFGCCERGKPTVMLRDTWTYNPTKGTPWRRMDVTPPFEGIQATSVAAKGNEIWLVGGWSQSRATLSHVAVLNTETLAWTMKSEHGEAPFDSRADHASAISPDGRWLFIFGGQHAKEYGRYWTRLKDTWRVELPSARASDWKQLGELPSARSSPALFVLSTGWLITLGGHWTPDMEHLDTRQEDVDGMQKHHEKTEFQTYNDVVGLNLAGGGEAGWKVLEPDAPWPKRDDCAAAVTSKGTILIFGGGTLYGGGGYHRDVWRLPEAPNKYVESVGKPSPSGEL